MVLCIPWVQTITIFKYIVTYFLSICSKEVSMYSQPFHLFILSLDYVTLLIYMKTFKFSPFISFRSSIFFPRHQLHPSYSIYGLLSIFIPMNLPVYFHVQNSDAILFNILLTSIPFRLCHNQCYITRIISGPTQC